MLKLQTSVVFLKRHCVSGGKHFINGVPDKTIFGEPD